MSPPDVAVHGREGGKEHPTLGLWEPPNPEGVAGDGLVYTCMPVDLLIKRPLAFVYTESKSEVL